MWSPFLAYSVGCNAGEFDNFTFLPDCIGEELVKSNACGAFAAVLNSRAGWFDPQEEWKYSGERILLRGSNGRFSSAGLSR